MDEKGEIQRGRSFGKLFDGAARSEDIYFVLEQIHAQGLHELAGIRLVALAIEQIPQPFKLRHVPHVHGMMALLVHPVRGYAVFSEIIHLFRADLDFHPFTFRSYDRAVQALIPVGLGHGNIILETSGHRFP